MEMGRSYKKLNNFDKAAEYSERAIFIFEGIENIMATLRLQMSQTAILVEKGRYEEAASLFHTVLAKYRENDNREEEGIALVEFAKLRVRQGDTESAEEMCRQARSLLPEMHLYQAADCYKLLNEWKEWDDTMYEIAQLHRAEQDFARAVSVLDSMRSFTRKRMEERGMAL